MLLPALGELPLWREVQTGARDPPTLRPADASRRAENLRGGLGRGSGDSSSHWESVCTSNVYLIKV